MSGESRALASFVIISAPSEVVVTLTCPSGMVGSEPKSPSSKRMVVISLVFTSRSGHQSEGSHKLRP